MREVNGIKVAFVEYEPYFSSFGSPSMHGTAKETGAQMVILLGPGKIEEDISDVEIFELIENLKFDNLEEINDEDL